MNINPISPADGMHPDSSWRTPQGNPELAILDADLQAHYLADMFGRWVPENALKVQIIRLMRQLLLERQHGAHDGKQAQDDVQHQHLPA